MNGTGSSGENDYYGLHSDDQESDILIPSCSDPSNASSVDSVHTTDLTDWESEAPDQSASPSDLSDTDAFYVEGDRRRKKRPE